MVIAIVNLFQWTPLTSIGTVADLVIVGVISKEVFLSPEHIDPNQCCTCFGLFEDDIGMESEWLQCSCTRWIHEGSIEDVVRSENGEEKLCPLCSATV